MIGHVEAPGGVSKPPPLAEAPIERIAVFRALMLGDMLCAVPALRAIRHAWPRAEITLVGLPWARHLVKRLSHCVDRFVAFPGHPGLPEVPCDVRELPGFLAHLQSLRFDLAVQLHGSGAIVNPLVASFGARHTAGFRNDHSWHPPQDTVLYREWPDAGHEIERLLSLTDHLGLERQGTGLDFPLQAADRAELERVWPGAAQATSYAVVHPGSQLPSRRWPAERFARAADALAAQGLTVVLTGSADEAPLVGTVAEAMRWRAVNLAGRTSLWSLGALVERAELVVSNDTGISHIAAALRTPSVIVSSGADVTRWAPLDTTRHRVLWHATSCRPCAHAVCPFGHECSKAIGVDDVVRAAAAVRRSVPMVELPVTPLTPPVVPRALPVRVVPSRKRRIHA